MLTQKDVWQALEQIKDPEIPVINIVEMGIVREVAINGAAVTVTMTPTFSGCPALNVMRDDILAQLRTLGVAHPSVNIVNAPAWSSDWITPEARAKLNAFGLAPPAIHGGDVNVILFDMPHCPRCGSADVILKNSFGTTLCRAMYVCNQCREPFEQFKGI